jgi:7-cyano-7-deazaguanine synthase
MSNEGQRLRKCLLLFSGGQDSAVCLAWALTGYDSVETLGFSYGQRHNVELECRPILREAISGIVPAWTRRLGVDTVLDLSVLLEVGETALTSGAEIAFDAKGLPNTFVPGRNLLFFTLAAALAYRRGIRDLVGGMCETDYSGYPDCRNETLEALNRAIDLGTDEHFSLITPLMWRTKAETWALAYKLGGDPLVDIIVEHTHTCYRGNREHRQDWGYGCGTCPACVLRAKGYRDWRENVLPSA